MNRSVWYVRIAEQELFFSSDKKKSPASISGGKGAEEQNQWKLQPQHFFQVFICYWFSFLIAEYFLLHIQNSLNHFS